jgi:hypothetical protein
MTRQSTGYIILQGEKMLLLRRMTSARHGYTQLKLRVSGKDGEHFENIEVFLSEDNDKQISDLRAGKVITF